MQPPVIYWYEPSGTSLPFDAIDAHYCQEAMAAHGFRLQRCSTPGQLLSLVESCPDGAGGALPLRAWCVAVLTASLAENAALAHALRSVQPAMGIVACVPDLSEETHLLALQAGIDATFQPSASRRLLIAILYSLVRRMGGVEPAAFTVGGSAGWQLLENAWKLVAPGGISVTLSTTERSFMQVLLGAESRSATHEQLARALGPVTGDMSVAGRERMSVMVSRLRRKVAKAGAQLPIRSLHGQGYMFTGPVS